MSWGDIPDWTDKLARALLIALRERDPYTYGHSLRVARNSRLLAKAAGLNEYEQVLSEYSSLFHDLGKLAIPDSILLKKGILTPQEREIMEIHPTKSVEILEPFSQIPFFRSLLPGIRHHHERIDGKGYPDHIQGDTIPLIARIIVITDTFDAMTTTRPYRKGNFEEFAYKELKKFSGRQFDSHLVQIFLDAHPTWGNIEEEISETYIARTFRRAG